MVKVAVFTLSTCLQQKNLNCCLFSPLFQQVKIRISHTVLMALLFIICVSSLILSIILFIIVYFLVVPKMSFVLDLLFQDAYKYIFLQFFGFNFVYVWWQHTHLSSEITFDYVPRNHSGRAGVSPMQGNYLIHCAISLGLFDPRTVLILPPF